MCLQIHSKPECRWTGPEVAILGADQKERGLWVRECEETISESMSPGTAVLRVRAMNADRSHTNSKLVFSVVKEVVDHDFVPNSSSGFIYVSKSLDFERTQVYRFQVAVQDISIH